MEERCDRSDEFLPAGRQGGAKFVPEGRRISCFPAGRQEFVTPLAEAVGYGMKQAKPKACPGRNRMGIPFM